MSPFHCRVKRLFDVALSAAGLVATGPVILTAAALARRDTGQSGFFRQTRVGLHGKLFRVVKIRTMRPVAGVTTTVTTGVDPRITRLGRLLRRSKIDELPQLWNVLLGEMSLVGPRPDVPDVIGTLREDDRRTLLSIRPGITGPATLKYRNEEELLARQPDPERYNREVILPDKVRINREYVATCRLRTDLACLWRTVFGGPRSGGIHQTGFTRPPPPPLPKGGSQKSAARIL